MVPLELCGIVLGNTYNFYRKAIFYREKKKYQLTKDEVQYIVQAHRLKANLSWDSIAQLKRLVNVGKFLSFISVKYDDLHEAQKNELPHRNIQYLGLQTMSDPLMVNCLVKKYKYIVRSISFTSICSVMLLITLLISGLWLAKVIVDVDVCFIEGIFTLLNNVVFVFSFVVIILIVIFQA